jgi:hypothetical protein
MAGSPYLCLETVLFGGPQSRVPGPCRSLLASQLTSIRFCSAPVCSEHAYWILAVAFCSELPCAGDCPCARLSRHMRTARRQRRQLPRGLQPALRCPRYACFVNTSAMPSSLAAPCWASKASANSIVSSLTVHRRRSDVQQRRRWRSAAGRADVCSGPGLRSVTFHLLPLRPVAASLLVGSFLPAV